MIRREKMREAKGEEARGKARSKAIRSVARPARAKASRRVVKSTARATQARTHPAQSSQAMLTAVGARVRALREEQGRTRKQLALSSGISERFLADLESGSGNISLSRLASLCRALGTSAGALLHGLEQESPSKKGNERGLRGRSKTREIRETAEAAASSLKHEIRQLASGLSREEERELLAWARARFGRSRGPRIALLGLRGAGKSTIGRALASRLGVAFIELDERVEAAAGLTLAGIFSLHGEDYYRRLAREVLARLLSELESAVIATGGSIVTDREALRLLSARCRTVWLQATPEDHWRRVLAQGDERPSAASANAQAELRALLQARAPLYAQAEISIDTSRLGPGGSVEAIVKAI